MNRILWLLLAVIMLLAACQPVSPAAFETPLSGPEVTAPEATFETDLQPTATATPSEPADFIELTLTGVDLLIGEITSPALADNLIGDPETRKVMIHLPPDYAASDKHYPVVYVLHYYGGSEISHVVEVGRAMNRLLEDGDIEEMILVYPNADSRFGGSKYLSSPTIGDYETYLTQDLVNFIDANFRTLAQRESRGVTGCSMGGDGAMYLALAYPDVYSVTAPVSIMPDLMRDPQWEEAWAMLGESPADFSEFQRLPWKVRSRIALAAAVAPNPDKPPFYLDMPYEMVDGEAQIVTEVMDKAIAKDMIHALEGYLDQPIRLTNVLLYHGEFDPISPVEFVRDYDKLLSDRGVDHEYLEAPAGHCNLNYAPVLQFMSDNLTFEE